MKAHFQWVTEELFEKMRSLRREFHRYPETGWTEYRTTWRVAEELKKAGFQVFTGAEACLPESRMGRPDAACLEACEKRAMAEGVPASFLEKIRDGKTGAVGVLRGETPGPVKVLRFDMDALPIREKESGLSSLHPGIMHACGHDGHLAAGLGLAGILGKNRKKMKGEVRLLFQPAEEGCRGARAMADRGWLRGADFFLGGHIGMGAQRLGEIIGCTSGFMATSKLDIEFRGKAAHAAKAPEKGRNALLAAAVCTVNAYAISRNSQGEGRVNIGRLTGGSGRNIVPDQAYLEAETRGETTEINRYMRDALERVARASAEMYGVSCSILEQGEAGTARSSPELIRGCRKAAEKMGLGELYGEDGVFQASEDAAVFMEEIRKAGGRAAYFIFGTPLKAEHHQPGFDFEEEVLRIMAEFYASAVLDAEA